MSRMILRYKSCTSNSKKIVGISFAISLLVHALVFLSFSEKTKRQYLLPAKAGAKVQINYTVQQLQKFVPRNREERGLRKRKMQKNEHRETTDNRNSNASTAKQDVASVAETYQHALLKKIHEHKYYPFRAKKMRLTGQVTLRFTVSRLGGLIGKVTIVTPSEHQILDTAAVQTIIRAAPFPAFPEEMRNQERAFMVTLDYSLQD